MNPERLIVAVDGPAASGKGTLAKRLAAHLGLPHLDTGLLYRAVAWRLLRDGRDPTDAARAGAAARDLQSEDLTPAGLRNQGTGQAASVVAAHPDVRDALLMFQRRFGDARGAVLDGRDVGTVIFPRARAKIYVTASLEARAGRRWREACGRGEDAVLETVRADLAARDERDSNRAAAPLRPAENAWRLDTTDLDANQAFEAALRHVTSLLPPGFLPP